MLEHDVVINDRNGKPYLSYGPRKEVDRNIEGCAPAEAEFWGIYRHPNGDVEAHHIADANDQHMAELISNYIRRCEVDEHQAAISARLPDGSGFATAKFPLPENHWLYEDTKFGDYDGKALLNPETDRHEFHARCKEAIRRATVSGKDMDFDPDALVQNLSVLVCGQFTNRAELTPQHQGYSEADLGDEPDRYK